MLKLVVFLRRYLKFVGNSVREEANIYLLPNHSVTELRDLIRVKAGIDPLREFSEVAREELRFLKRR